MIDIFRMSDDQDMTDEMLVKFIRQNEAKTIEKYDPLWAAYDNDYEIFHAAQKPAWKPDNRLSVNLAKYVVDTFVGFSYGIPIKVISDDEHTQEIISAIDANTDSDDVIFELATNTAIFGRAYRIAYVDEGGEIGTAFLDPREAFMVYNESIKPKPRYFVRTYKGVDKKTHGSISDPFYVKYFHLEGSDVIWDDAVIHGFGMVPAVECVMNRNRHGIFEDVLSLINAYNKVLSEKADDVEYFSDSYMKVLGAAIDEETIRFMRQNRVINLAGKAGADVIVDFLQKPSADGTQENLLNRIERLIFVISMICNISDDNFATSSGIALRYKLLPMQNLASAAWRKMAQSLDAYYKIVCASPVVPLPDDAWQTLSYVHTLNYPANIADEANTAVALGSVVSKRTQLSTLSIVDDVDAEIEQIKKEEDEYATPYATNRSEAGDNDE